MLLTGDRAALVIGASGQLGRELTAALAARGGRHRVADCRDVPGGVRLDLQAPHTIAGVLEQVNPALVVNAAAYTAVDRAESEETTAMAVNAHGPAALARACRDRDIPLIHFSTDYVFDGRQRRPYTEADAVAPLSVYGRSKAAGEAAIRASGVAHLIFRTSWLYAAGAANFVSTMLRLFQGPKPVRVVDDQTGCPTWARELAGEVVGLLARISLQDLSQLSGTYHLCGGGHTTWFGFARAIAARAQPPPAVAIEPISSAEFASATPRPAYAVLDCTRARQRLGVELRDWQQQLDDAMPLFNQRPGGP